MNASLISIPTTHLLLFSLLFLSLSEATHTFTKLINDAATSAISFGNINRFVEVWWSAEVAEAVAKRRKAFEKVHCFEVPIDTTQLFSKILLNLILDLINRFKIRFSFSHSQSQISFINLNQVQIRSSPLLILRKRLTQSGILLFSLSSSLYWSSALFCQMDCQSHI